MTTRPPPSGRIARARETADELQRRAREGFEQAQSRHASVHLAAQAFELDRARAGGLLAGGLAYKVFLWEIALVLFLVSALGVATDLAESDPSELARQAGLTAALTGTIAKAVAVTESGRLWLLFLGAFLTIWAGMGVFRGLRLVGQLAWGSRALKRSAAIGSLGVTGFGIAIIAMQALLPKLVSSVGIPGILHFVLGLAAASALSTWALVLLNEAPVGMTALLPGGLLLGVGLRLLGLAASTYFALRLDHADDLYGSLGIAIVMMLYLFLMARLFVAAQFLNATLFRRRDEAGDAQAG